MTYAVPIEPGKFAEAIELSKKCERLGLITEDVTIPSMLNDAAQRAGVKLDLFLKVDCGYPTWLVGTGRLMSVANRYRARSGFAAVKS